MRIPRAIQELVDAFGGLPGIGPKTAQRLTFYLLHTPEDYLASFARSLTNLKKDTIFCEICKNIDTISPCQICRDDSRDHTTVVVVEEPLDVLAIERAQKFKGIYHVLHGSINPLENIGPDEIFIKDLVDRIGVANGKPKIKEVIIATNPTMEGEATAMFLLKILKAKDRKLKITRLGMGIPTGADLEYADETTIMRALEGRREL